MDCETGETDKELYQLHQNAQTNALPRQLRCPETCFAKIECDEKYEEMYQQIDILKTYFPYPMASSTWDIPTYEIWKAVAPMKRPWKEK